jgi:hypothetical protein
MEVGGMGEEDKGRDKKATCGFKEVRFLGKQRWVFGHPSLYDLPTLV